MKPPKNMKLITENHLENRSNVVYSLFAEELLTDVTLHCKDGSIKAHKLVLASCSPYFRKLLVENHCGHEHVTILLTRGFTLERLRKVIEVAYKGFVDVSSDAANSICELVEELDMTGVRVLDNENSDNEGKTNGYGRDTRFKGQKRVAVDFTNEMVEDTPSKMIRLDKSPEKKSPTTEKKVAVVTKTSSGSPPPYLQNRTRWTLEQLVQAIDAVRVKKMSINKASQLYNIPSRTLRRRLGTGNTSKGPQSPNTTFDAFTEKMFVSCLRTLHSKGFVPSKNELRDMAYRFATFLKLDHKFNKITERAGYDWLNNFLRRNPTVEVRRSDGVQLCDEVLDIVNKVYKEHQQLIRKKQMDHKEEESDCESSSSDEASVTSENMADADAREGPIDPSELLKVVHTEVVDGGDPENRTPAKLTSWDKKPRKFQCELCTSSFKRASHLTRHQLVHTGERPYACTQCDKAFSRHDKLKHHIKKNHDVDPVMVLLQQTTESPEAPYTMGTVRVRSPSPMPVTPVVSRQTGGNIETSYDDTKHIIYSPNYSNPTRLSTPITLSQLSNSVSTPSSLNNSGAGGDPATSTVKKGRGRPRKYPPPPPQLVKRPRGRPRLNPIGVPAPGGTESNYDITNLPFGDLEYLTKPLHDEMDDHIEDPDIIEPLIQISTGNESETTPELPPIEPVVSITEECDDAASQKEEDNLETKIEVEDEKVETVEESRPKTFFEEMGLCELRKIGECTVSVSDVS